MLGVIVKVRSRQFQNSLWVHVSLLGIWMVLGALLRFWNLGDKPVWTDEFATLVFSLGHSFRTIPLDQVLTSNQLLEPLRVQPLGTVPEVVQQLMQESNHPPLYFVLTHWWLQLWGSQEGFGSAWVARSLAASVGVLTIPAMFGLGFLAFNSLQTGQLAAALMAVSPFGVYLAQEARHYTLPLLWMIASLACLALALRYLQQEREATASPQRKKLPHWLVLSWVGCNCLGMATHYFFALTLLAEGIALLWVLNLTGSTTASQAVRSQGKSSQRLALWGCRLDQVAIGTLAGGLVWLPFWRNGLNSELTRWVFEPSQGWATALQPLGNIAAMTITMVTLLPLQEVPRSVRIASVVGMLAFMMGLLWSLYRQRFPAEVSSPVKQQYRAMVGFVLGAIALMLILEYALGASITRGLRYGFVYFPGILLLLAFALGTRSTPSPYHYPWGTRKVPVTIALTLLMGLVGSSLVVTNLGYQKVHRPDSVTQALQTWAQHPALVAIAHQTHGQTGRLMGIAWERRQQADALPKTSYYLDHLACESQACQAPSLPLQQAIATRSEALDLWLINYRGLAQIPAVGDCHRIHLRPETTSTRPPSVDGYAYQLFRCPKPQAPSATGTQPLKESAG